MISMLASLAALGLTVVSPAASAQDVTAAATVATATVAAPNAAPSAKRYCISEAPTGTRVAKRTCLTRKEWQMRGVDLDQQ